MPSLIPMTQHSSKDSIDLAEDPVFQEKDWRFQRIGWVIMILIIIAALLGLFGDGPFSHGNIAADDGTSVVYEKITRIHKQTSTDILIPLSASAISASEQIETQSYFDVAMSAGFVHGMGLTSVVPAPRHMIQTDSMVVFRFGAFPDTRVLQVTFKWQPPDPGKYSARIVMGENLSVYKISTIVLP